MTTQIKGNATSTFGGNVDVTGNVITDAPAFRAYGSSQSFSSATYTKLNMSIKEFDTNSNYDTTNYRFTPTVAGYYQINGNTLVQGTSKTNHVIAIYKNGSRASFASSDRISTSDSVGMTISTLLYLNGTTDYVELYVYGIGTSLSTASGSDLNSFSAFLARAV
jgi:hypothetical protein